MSVNFFSLPGGVRKYKFKYSKSIYTQQEAIVEFRKQGLRGRYVLVCAKHNWEFRFDERASTCSPTKS